MAYKPGVIGFVRIPDAVDPFKVYAIGPGGKPIENERELMEYTGEKTVAEAFKHVRLVSPEEALSLGVTDPKAKRKVTRRPPPEAPKEEEITPTRAPKEEKITPTPKPTEPRIGDTKIEDDWLLEYRMYTTPIGTSFPRWERVRRLTPQEQEKFKEPEKKPREVKLIRFTTSPDVYDISEGTLRHVTADEFQSRGYNWEDVKNIDPTTAGLRKDPTGKVFVIIDDQEIHIPDMETFDKAGLSRTIFLEEGKPVIDVPDLIDEYTSGEKLGIIWDRDPDLRDLYDRNGNGRPGTGAEGTTIYEWATHIGWKEYPELLEEYRPENVVRAAYQMLFDRDPFDPTNPDPGALSWVQAIKSGEISGFNELTGKMKLDRGGEWASLTRAEQDENLIKWERTIQDIPEFAEFFPQAKIYEEVKKETEDFYNKQLDHYLEGKEIEEKRTIEDWETLTKELTEDEEAELTEAQLQFRNALKTATEAYGQAGLTFSTIRREGEQQLREALKRRKERISLEAERAKGKLTTEKERRLEDLRRQEEEQRRKVERAKAIETEQTFAGREARAIQRYMLGLQFAETIPGVQNIYGQSAFTGFGKFMPPSIQEKTKKQIGEMFGELKPYGT